MKVIEQHTKRYYLYSDGRIQNIKTGRFLKFHTNGRGYLHTGLQSLEGKRVRVRIHRLVAEHFIPNPNNLPCVNHIDGNKSNNDISNLEWCTYRDNTIHMLENNLSKSKKRSVIIKCDGCNREYRRALSTIKKYNFCDRDCYLLSANNLNIIVRGEAK